MHCKEVTHSDGSYEKKSRRRLSWKYGTELKSHGTLIDWYTGREWPLNCMIVISAWWRSNMSFQGRWKWHIPVASHGVILSGRLNYYITRWRQEVSELEIRWVTAAVRVGVWRPVWWQDVVEKATAQQKGPSGPPMEFGDPLVTRCGRVSPHPAEWALGLRLSCPGERERHNADGHKSGGQYIAVLFRLQLPLTVKPWVSFSNPFQ